MRELGTRYGIPGVALTALSSPVDRQRSAAAGFAHHLVKPVNLDELELLLMTVAQGRTEADPLAPKRLSGRASRN